MQVGVPCSRIPCRHGGQVSDTSLHASFLPVRPNVDGSRSDFHSMNALAVFLLIGRMAAVNRSPYRSHRRSAPCLQGFEVFSQTQPPVVRTNLRVDGRIPTELIGGSYLRNGGNFARGESKSVLNFDGHGFIHRVSFCADHANYSSTFVKTDAWELEEELDQPVARLSPRGIFEALRRNLRLGRANTNILRWGSGLWAVEESDAPIEIALERDGVGIRTIRSGSASVGDEGCMRSLVSLLRTEKRAFTGHPTVIRDGSPPLMVGYGYSHEAKWPLCVYTVSEGDAVPACLQLEGVLEGGLWGTGWQRPITIHNAAASRDALFIPVSIAPLGCPEWIRVPLPLREEGACGRIVCKNVNGFVGECIGAYRCGSTSEEHVFAFVHPPDAPYGAKLVRLRVRNGDLLEEEVLWPEQMFMCGCTAQKSSPDPPRFIFALGRSQRGIAAGKAGMSGIDALVKLDVDSGTSSMIYACDGDGEVTFGEPCFVPADAAVAEDDGFLITYRSDGRTCTSALCIFDARSFSSTPLAVVELGVPVPHGAHGTFVPPSS